MYWSKTALQKYLGVKSLIYYHIFFTSTKTTEIKVTLSDDCGDDVCFLSVPHDHCHSLW